jgi:hypothetical protein
MSETYATDVFAHVNKHGRAHVSFGKGFTAINELDVEGAGSTTEYVESLVFSQDWFDDLAARLPSEQIRTFRDRDPVRVATLIHDDEEVIGIDFKPPEEVSA